MLDTNINGLSGPDFLDAVADAEQANGLDINADVYRQRAQQWRTEQAEKTRLLETLETTTRELAKAHTARHRLPSVSRYAVTPSDRS